MNQRRKTMRFENISSKINTDALLVAYLWDEYIPFKFSSSIDDIVAMFVTTREIVLNIVITTIIR
jgi:hypothetical protein